jgi:outer membrane protein assembly factor BamB
MTGFEPRTRRRFLALCGASAATFSGCAAIPLGESNAQQAASPTGTWPTFAYDRANTGHNPETSEPSAEKRLWEMYVDGYYALPTPVVVGDTLYVGSNDYLYAIERASGKRRWSHRLGALTHRFTATVVGDTVYAVGRGKTDFAKLESGEGVPGRVVALDANDGEERWRREGYVSGSPTVVDDLLYYPTNTPNRGTVRAIDRTDGTQQWRFAFGNGAGTSAFATPAYADRTLFVLGNRNERGRLYALDPATGEPKWHYEADAKAYAAPIVADGQVLIATADGTLHVVNGADGTRVWRARVGEAIQSPPALADGRAFVITEGKLVAVELENGRIAWRGDIGNTHYSTVVTTPGSVVVGGPTMYAFDHAGDVRWSREVPGYAGSYGEPAVVDGEVFAGVCIKETSNSLYDNYVYRMR